MHSIKLLRSPYLMSVFVHISILIVFGLPICEHDSAVVSVFTPAEMPVHGIEAILYNPLDMDNGRLIVGSTAAALLDDASNLRTITIHVVDDKLWVLEKGSYGIEDREDKDDTEIDAT